MDVKQKNVWAKPLHQHSSPKSFPSSSLPSTLKIGFCNESSPIAATITNSFLDLISQSGTDLRKQGVGPGQRFCVEAAKWKEAMDKGDDVPRVKLEATHEKALDTVDFATLKKFAAKQDHDSVILPNSRPSDAARSSGDIGGKEPKA
ncbi:hypothetical protein K491DRAFT_657963 [Lophiostoma macrostomum CBS 122681]|uniref:Uncharacterized protein n=1 Tax=Lophiostoma macrostomum CBS 122681 TaxID=1314788 RepID=A0A6A6T7D1_9PLEO|nr:hypothetical protein K491DRAFT_657963 [Lophiostoma macrostomum CBS 122681]